jgi:hypothetical protein
MDGGTLADIWSDDHLHRSEDAQYIATFLENRLNERRAADLPTHYVLNINSAWGTGKTFFLSRFAAQLKAAGYIVASVDAWSTDHAEDPLLAVMAAIHETCFAHLIWSALSLQHGPTRPRSNLQPCFP